MQICIAPLVASELEALGDSVQTGCVRPYAEVKSSVFNFRLKTLRELADLQSSEREFQTAGALTEKALADKANVTLGAVNRS